MGLCGAFPLLSNDLVSWLHYLGYCLPVLICTSFLSLLFPPDLSFLYWTLSTGSLGPDFPFGGGAQLDFLPNKPLLVRM